MALYDTLLQMRSDGVHVTTKVLGGTYSMGAVLLQAGTERLMGRGSFLMIHEGSLEFSSTYAGVKDLTQFMELFHKRAAEVLAEPSILSKKEVKERWARRDWYMDYREAKRLGFVDGVG
jgi:ATP-dependent protease ClpP protease subunit